MATYADLKARIAREMVRADLLDDLLLTLEQHIYDACEEYADMRFWFNQTIQSATTTEDDSALVIPTALRIVDRIAGPYSDLIPNILNEFTNDGALPQTGGPTHYTYIDGGLTLWPTPDDEYDLTLYGILQIDPPTLDSDSNAWTNEAQGLISSHARMTLYRDQFRDPEGAAGAANATAMHLRKLRRETDRRLRTRLEARLVAPSGQPVRRHALDRL